MNWTETTLVRVGMGQLVMKDVELRLVSELMKNSRRSDRELAKAIGVSQPTVHRTIRKLEKEGIINQYTMIPNFSKLGLKLLSVTFVKRRKDVTAEEQNKIMKMGKDVLEKSLKNIMTMRGIGLGYETIIVSVHEDYSSYQELVRDVKQFPYSDLSNIQSFLIDLDDKMQYRPFTLAFLAKYITNLAEKRKET
jgi:DNA-binding Lrp family transcriptional regulator